MWIRTIAAFAIIAGGAPVASAQMPPRDLAASPWLNTVAPRLFGQFRTAELVRRCGLGDLDDRVRITVKFFSAVKTLPPADADYANRLTIAGAEQGVADYQANSGTACKGIGEPQLKATQDLGYGRKGFWDAP